MQLRYVWAPTGFGNVPRYAPTERSSSGTGGYVRNWATSAAVQRATWRRGNDRPRRQVAR